MLTRICVVVALLAAAIARADAPPEAAASAAHAHFADGEAHYREGRWSEALTDFRAGYALDPRPEFLINIAQTERRLGLLDDALASCERFLLRAPDSPLVAQVKQLMKELRAERTAARAEAAAVQGRALYEAGQYERALDAFQRAYMDNMDEPRYLLSLAECYRALHRTADAQRFYRLFLHERPGAPERASVEAHLRELEHPAPAPTTPTPTPATPPPPPVASSPLVVATPAETVPPRRRPAWKRWWFWTAIGGGVAVGVGLGVGLGLHATSGNSFMPTLPPFGPNGQSALVVH